MSRIASEFIMIDFYSLFTPTCTSSFYPDDHLGRFMGFSRFVELKSARFVEKKINKKDFLWEIFEKDLYLFGKVLFTATKGF